MSVRLREPGARQLLSRPSFQVGVTVVVGVAVAFQAIDPAAELVRSLVAVVAVLAVGTYCLSRSPRWAIAGFLFCTFTGLNVFETSVGAVNLRPADAFYVPLVVWALVRRRSPPASDIGQGPLMWFLAALGLSLLPLGAESVGGLVTALVPWARLVQTLSIIWLLPRVLPDEEDRRFAVGAAMAAAAYELATAFVKAPSIGLLAGRLEGGVGPNAEGLIAGVLLVLVLYAPVPRGRGTRIALGVLAVGALFSARSVGSIAAVGIMIGFAGFGRAGDEPTVRSLRPLRVLLLGAALVALIGLVRPENLPNSAGFGDSSAQQRLILGTAGMDVFLHHPFLGVGWQRSTDPSVLGSEQLTAELRRQFPGVRDDFFPEATSTTTTTASVHNSYIQVLAESGLAGGLAMVFAAAACATRLRALRRKLTGTEAQLARSMLVVLGVTLIWLNDNALFGAQPESVLLAFSLGLLASFRAPGDESEVATATATARA